MRSKIQKKPKLKKNKNMESQYLEFFETPKLPPVVYQTFVQPSPHVFVQSTTTSGAYEDPI